MTSGAVTAKVRQRGLDGTGVTEDVARALFGAVGSGNARWAIVELEPVRQINEASGDHKVECTLGIVEVAEPGSRAHDILGELARALYRDRRVKDGEIEGTGESGERATDDVLTEGSALIERDAEGKPTGTWAGDVDDAGEALVAPPVDEQPDEPQQAGPGADDPSYDPDPGIPHKFMAGTTDPANCAVAGCGKGTRARVHRSED